MSVFKRGDTYWCRFTTPGGERIRRSCETGDLKAAEQFEATLKLEYWKTAKLGEKRDPFWDELAARFIDEKAENRSIGDDILRLTVLQKFMSGLRASQVTRDQVQAVIKEVAADRLAAQAQRPGRVKPPRPLAAATLKQYIVLIQRVLNLAANEWQVIDAAPRLKKPKVSNKRRRVETPAKIAEIVLRVQSQHLKDIITFAAMTGLRLGSLLAIELAWIEWSHRALLIPANVMKADVDLAIPLNDTAWAIVKRRMSIHKTHLFSYADHPIGEINETSLYKVFAKAGVHDFHIHDLRRSFATWLGRLRVPDRHIKALGAWRQEDRGDAMFRYVWAEVDVLREDVKLLDGLWEQGMQEARRVMDKEKADSTDIESASLDPLTGTNLAQTCGSL